MTIETTSSSIAYQGNGATTTFSYAFLIPSQDNLIVTITDSAGSETVLSTSEYSVTGIDDPDGGIVTYPLSGSPLALGEYITIQRDMPLTQETNLSNQGGYYPDVVEAALDTLEMQIQQVDGQFSHALVTPLSDPDTNLTIPNATARAGMYLGFDADGDPIAGTPVSGATVSSVMVPVVEAATLAAARTAFGLGDAATLSVGTGLTTVSSALTAANAVTNDTISQAVTAAFNQTVRTAVGPITYTLARANTLFNGFAFYIFAQTGAITITPNAADAIGNLSVGTSYVIQPGYFARIVTNGAASGIWNIDAHPIGATLSAGSPIINGYLAATRAAGAETISVKTLGGNDPSTMDPVYCIFRNATAGSGVYVVRVVTSALSITIPSTATMGATNAVPFKLWAGVLDNAGTVEMFITNPKNSTTFSIVALEGAGLITSATTAITTAADNAQVVYSASSRNNVAFALIGSLSYTLAAVGTWGTAPSPIVNITAATTLPGKAVQEQFGILTTTATSVGATYTDTGQTVSITLHDSANVVMGWVLATVGNSNNDCTTMQVVRDTTAICIGDAASNRKRAGAAATVLVASTHAVGLGFIDSPADTSAHTYKTQIAGASGNAWINRSNTDTDTAAFPRTASTILVREIAA